MNEWQTYRLEFLKFCTSKYYSSNYTNDIFRWVNKWGFFLSARLDKGFEKLESLNIFERIQVDKLHKKSPVPRPGKSHRISFELLNEKRRVLVEVVYNTIFVGIAFGLCSEEVLLSLKSPEFHVVEENKLFVYQHKLERTVENERARWKSLEANSPEQNQALEIIKSGKLYKKGYVGLAKAIRAAFGRGYTPYGPRKEFYPKLVQLYGRAVAMDLMGHKDMRTGIKYYDDPTDRAPKRLFNR